MGVRSRFGGTRLTCGHEEEEKDGKEEGEDQEEREADSEAEGELMLPKEARKHLDTSARQRFAALAANLICKLRWRWLLLWLLSLHRTGAAAANLPSHVANCGQGWFSKINPPAVDAGEICASFGYTIIDKFGGNYGNLCQHATSQTGNCVWGKRTCDITVSWHCAGAVSSTSSVPTATSTPITVTATSSSTDTTTTTSTFTTTTSTRSSTQTATSATAITVTATSSGTATTSTTMSVTTSSTTSATQSATIDTSTTTEISTTRSIPTTSFTSTLTTQSKSTQTESGTAVTTTSSSTTTSSPTSTITVTPVTSTTTTTTITTTLSASVSSTTITVSSQTATTTTASMTFTTLTTTRTASRLSSTSTSLTITKMTTTLSYTFTSTTLSATMITKTLSDTSTHATASVTMSSITSITTTFSYTPTSISSSATMITKTLSDTSTHATSSITMSSITRITTTLSYTSTSISPSVTTITKTRSGTSTHVTSSVTMSSIRSITTTLSYTPTSLSSSATMITNTLSDTSTHATSSVTMSTITSITTTLSYTYTSISPSVTTITKTRSGTSTHVTASATTVTTTLRFTTTNLSSTASANTATLSLTNTSTTSSTLTATLTTTLTLSTTETASEITSTATATTTTADTSCALAPQIAHGNADVLSRCAGLRHGQECEPNCSVGFFHSDRGLRIRCDHGIWQVEGECLRNGANASTQAAAQMLIRLSMELWQSNKLTTGQRWALEHHEALLTAFAKTVGKHPSQLRLDLLEAEPPRRLQSGNSTDAAGHTSTALVNSRGEPVIPVPIVFDARVTLLLGQNATEQDLWQAAEDLTSIASAQQGEALVTALADQLQTRNSERTPVPLGISMAELGTVTFIAKYVLPAAQWIVGDWDTSACDPSCEYTVPNSTAGPHEEREVLCSRGPSVACLGLGAVEAGPMPALLRDCSACAKNVLAELWVLLLAVPVACCCGMFTGIGCFRWHRSGPPWAMQGTYRLKNVEGIKASWQVRTPQQSMDADAVIDTELGVMPRVSRRGSSASVASSKTHIVWEVDMVKVSSFFAKQGSVLWDQQLKKYQSQQSLQSEQCGHLGEDAFPPQLGRQRSGTLLDACRPDEKSHYSLESLQAVIAPSESESESLQAVRV